MKLSLLFCSIFTLSSSFVFVHRQPKFNSYLPIIQPSSLLSQIPTKHVYRSSNTESISNSHNVKNASGQQQLKKVINMATNIFPLWVLLSCVVGNVKPSLLSWFSPYITPALALTMLSMGMTLTIDDFSRVLKQPQLIAVGFIAQYLIMPTSAYYVAKFMKLGNELSTGLILVGCAPGGTASNLVSLIAEADVPLSVLMTLASTIAAVFMTPFLITFLTKSYVPVKSADLVYSTLNVVLAPVIAGISMNTLFPKFCSKISEYAALPCVLLVSMICGAVTASNKGLALGATGYKLLISIIMMHSIGFLFGYVFAKALKSSEQQARTIRFVIYCIYTTSSTLVIAIFLNCVIFIFQY